MPDEKIYTIPLRKAFRKARAKRVPYAARLVRQYIAQHAKADDVKLGQHLNHALWERSITRPPRRVRVKVVKDGAVAKAELMGFDYVEFKAAAKTEKKDMREKLLERLGPKAAKKEAEEQKIEGRAEEKPEPAEQKTEIKVEEKAAEPAQDAANEQKAASK